jgi:hypothetical protein
MDCNWIIAMGQLWRSLRLHNLSERNGDKQTWGPAKEIGTKYLTWKWAVLLNLFIAGKPQLNHWTCHDNLLLTEYKVDYSDF